MSKDWVIIYRTAQIQEAEIVCGFLEENSIKAFKINKTDSMHVHLTNGEVEIYVNPEDVIKAKHLISKNKL